MKKILKTFIVATICLMAQTAVSAEENTDSKNSNKNLFFNRGYRANIELDWSNGGKGFGFTHYGLTTSQGYSFGNGLYLGAGLGAIVEPHDGPSSDYFFSLPVFADLKYSFTTGALFSKRTVEVTEDLLVPATFTVFAEALTNPRSGLTDIFSMAPESSIFDRIKGEEDSISGGAGIGRLADSAADNSPGSREVVVPLSTRTEAARLVESYLGQCSKTHSKLRLSKPSVKRLVYIPCARGADGVSLRRRSLTIVFGPEVWARVAENTSQRAFDALCERLETFGRNELGAWATQYSVAELRAMGAEQLRLARRYWEQRDLGDEKLFLCVSAYRKGLSALETLNPKPAFAAELGEGLREAEALLAERHEAAAFAVDQAMNTQRYEDAAEALRKILRMIPDRDDPRNIEATERLLAVENRYLRGGR